MMNRNSNTLFLESPNAITPVPWVNNAPDFTGFTEPTLSVLQDAYQANINNIVIIPDPITEPPTPVIRIIDMRRLRLALLQLNLLDDIDAAIAAKPRQAQIEWEYATDVKADYPLILQLATAMSLDIDEIFDLAESFT